MSNNKNKNFIPQRQNVNPYVKKGGKLKPSFWIVLVLMIFWTVGSVFGIFATVKGCNGSSSSSMRTVSADENLPVICQINSDYKNGRLMGYESGAPELNNYFFDHLNFRVSGYPDKVFDSFRITYNGLIVGDSVGGYYLSLCTDDITNVYSYYGSLPSNISDAVSVSYDEWIYSCGTIFFDCSVPQGLMDWLKDNCIVSFGYPAVTIVGSNVVTDNFTIDINYTFNVVPSLNCFLPDSIIIDGNYTSFSYDKNSGAVDIKGCCSDIIVTCNCLSYDDIYQKGLDDGRSYYSLGFFQGGTFKCYAGDRNYNTDYSDWVNLPTECVVPYYSGFYFQNPGESFLFGEYISCLCTGDYSVEPCSIVCDFGINGKSLGGFYIFSVLRVSEDHLYSQGEFGSGVEFRFTDNTRLTFNTADDYFNYCDLTDYEDKKLRSVEWFVSREDIDFFGLTSNLNVVESYDKGYNVGHDEGYSYGYGIGKSDGIAIGKNLAVQGSFSFLDLMSAVVDAPIQAISGLLNFDLLGFNMLNFFFALCTCALIITVVRMFL